MRCGMPPAHAFAPGRPATPAPSHEATSTKASPDMTTRILRPTLALGLLALAALASAAPRIVHFEHFTANW